MVEQKRLSEEVIESLPLGIIIVDRDMNVVQLNKRAQELTGCTPDTVGGYVPERFAPGLWAEGSALHQALSTDEQVEPRVTSVASSATEADRSAGRQPSPEPAAWTASTRTGNRGQRRLLVGAAPFAEGYLLSLQKASSFHQIEGDMISDISHDIRGPLATIQAYTELLVDGFDEGDPELRRQFLEIIGQRTRHLADLMTNLTYLVRRDLGCLDMSKASVSLRDATREVLATCQVQARRQDVQLSLCGSDEPHATFADPDALSALLKNVVNNAIKFSRAGGKVVVSLKRLAGDHVVTVTDTGCGIARQDLPHVFEPFYRGRNAIAARAEGSGLGLTLVKAVTEAHGGSVRLESEEGKGTSVTVRLPGEEGSPHTS